MQKLYIKGKNKLFGDYPIQGAKNSVLPILAASLICDGKTVISGCPRLTDVSAATSILSHLGCKVTRDGDRLSIDTKDVSFAEIPASLANTMRSSIVFLGSIISRFKKAVVSYPGGCELGPRPIDLHISSLKKLGVNIDDTHGMLSCDTNGIKGSEIHLGFPSVGATENIIIAAAISSGTTTVYGCAREPEIIALANFLTAAGANISGAGTSKIIIKGVKKLKSISFKIPGDRIEAATVLSAVCIAGGDVKLKGIDPAQITGVISVFGEMGCEITTDKDMVRIISDNNTVCPLKVRSMPYPGFPTDSMPLLMAATLKSQGSCIFIEGIFESRFKHSGELVKMGADISALGTVAVVRGVDELYGADVIAMDLRGGAALVVAALGAQGQTVISETHHIDRGYEFLDVKLKNIGADIYKK